MIRKRISIGGRYLRKCKVFRLVGFLVILGAGSMIGFLGWWKWVTLPVGSGTGQVVVAVPKGATVDEIGKRLRQERLIRSVAAFKLMVMKLKVSREIQAGDFRLSGKMNLAEVVNALTHGSLDIWVTLPEGWRREQMAQRLAENLPEAFDAEEFVRLSAAQEGYLFPDTYLIPKEASAGAVVKLLTETFRQKVGTVDKDTIILASIVEREAQGEADRKLVAEILLKRLKLNMGLNADATLQYVIATQGCKVGRCENWWPVPTGADKKIASPFNTYMNAGLTAGPIANPGLGAIKAVLGVRDTPYLYYLHDAKGMIHPAKTFEEHQANISRYLAP